MEYKILVFLENRFDEMATELTAYSKENYGIVHVWNPLGKVAFLLARNTREQEILKELADRREKETIEPVKKVGRPRKEVVTENKE